MNQCAKYLSRGSFSSNARHTHTHPTDCSVWTTKEAEATALDRMILALECERMDPFGCGLNHGQGRMLHESLNSTVTETMLSVYVKAETHWSS